MALARKGWRTAIRISRETLSSGGDDLLSVGFWAESSYWKGWSTDVCLHDHLLGEMNDPALPAAIDDLAANVLEACLRAERDLWDSIPCATGKKMPDGRLILGVNSAETRHCAKRPRDFFPTEALPPGPDAGPDRHIDALLAAVGAGMRVEDSINPFFGRSRFSRDCKDRDWGYRLRLAVREIDGVRIQYEPQEFSTRLLAAPVASTLIHASKRALLDHFEAYAPSGALAGMTSNGLPPGFRTLQEVVAEHEARSLAKMPDTDDPLTPEI